MHMPRPDRMTLALEFGGRVLLALLTFNYFLNLPAELWTINLSLVIAGLIGYLITQSILLGYALFGQVVFGRSAGWAMPAAVMLDAGIVFVAIISDPYTAPPTLLLLLIAALHVGLRRNRFALIGAFAVIGSVGTAALYVRAEHFIQPITYDITWLLSFSAAALLCFGLLALRQHILRDHAERFSDQDIETQLLNRRGFNNAATYLVPLHQRMQLPLSLMVASLDTNSTQLLETTVRTKVMRALADLTRQRNRRSDVIARLSDNELIFMMFDTPLAGSETLAKAILAGFREWAAHHQVDARITFGMVDVPETAVAIDQLIARARHSIQRAQKHPSAPAIVTASL